MTLVIAHIGHWYQQLLYLAPLLVLIVLAIAGRMRDSGD